MSSTPEYKLARFQQGYDHKQLGLKQLFKDEYYLIGWRLAKREAKQRNAIAKEVARG